MESVKKLLSCSKDDESSLKTGQRLWVWDFDETILHIHAYGLRLTVADANTRPLEKDCADLPFLRRFIADVLQAGDLVAVASFGRYEVIQAYMERISAGDFTRYNISTPSTVGTQDGYMVPQLEKLTADILCRGKAVTDADRSRVVFFDDSMPNVNGANLGGFLAFHTPKAFTRGAWRDACSSAGNRLRAEDALLGSGKSEAGAAEGASPPSSESA